MALVRISTVLPFPLRVDPTPYCLEYRGTPWTLRVERVQRATPDERLAGPGTTADMVVDREGQLAYSRVAGEAQFGGSGDEAALGFLGALNFLVAHARDVLGHYWIRTLELSDLYGMRIQIDNHIVQNLTAGRGGGFTLAVIGLTQDAAAGLNTALASGRLPPVWRDMQLDAIDALSLGRDEDCAVLGWSALEAACRHTLPGMAYRTGLTPVELAQRLDPKNRTSWHSRPPYSHEEAVERVSNGLRIVELAAELTDPQIYHAESVKASVDLPFRLRNRVVHQGVRICHTQAYQALESVNSVMEQALALRNVEPPPATLSWRNRYTRVREDVKRFAASNDLRLVLAHPRDGYFQMEMMDRDLWVRFDARMPPRMAAVLMLAQWDAWRRERLDDRPKLKINRHPHWLAGATTRMAAVVEACVCSAEAMLAQRAAYPAVAEVARFASSYIVGELACQPPVDLNDARFVTLPAQLAQYLAVLPPRSRSARLRPLSYSQPDIAERAQQWAQVLASVQPDQPHDRCAALRRIHRDSLWLDTILVLCPFERLAYGSQAWPIDDAP